MATNETEPASAEAIAETFINGNRTAAVHAISEQPSPLHAAILACEVLEVLREYYGDNDAASFLRAMRARA